MRLENTSRNTHNVVAQLLLEEEHAGRVLDIPSGAGAFTKRLLDLNIEVHSADIDHLLQVENPNFRLVDMNLTLPYDDGFFDAVVCIDGIEHLERPFDFIRQSHRVIRSEGVIIISTPNINALRSRWRWLWTSHHNKAKVPLNEATRSPLHHINMMSYQRLRYMLHTAGFRIARVSTNRVKAISWIYAVLIPFAYFITRHVYEKEESDPRQRRVNQEICRTLFGRPLLFGETMIVKAVRK